MLSFTVQFGGSSSDKCFIAHCQPYTTTDLKRDLDSLMLDPVRAALVRRSSLCATLGGQQVEMLTIGDPQESASERRSKQLCVVSGRVHPGAVEPGAQWCLMVRIGETNASWMMRGVIDFVTSPEAAEMRKMFEIVLLPMLK